MLDRIGRARGRVEGRRGRADGLADYCAADYGAADDCAADKHGASVRRQPEAEMQLGLWPEIVLRGHEAVPIGPVCDAHSLVLLQLQVREAVQQSWRRHIKCVCFLVHQEADASIQRRGRGRGRADGLADYGVADNGAADYCAADKHADRRAHNSGLADRRVPNDGLARPSRRCNQATKRIPMITNPTVVLEYVRNAHAHV